MIQSLGVKIFTEGSNVCIVGTIMEAWENSLKGEERNQKSVTESLEALQYKA